MKYFADTLFVKYRQLSGYQKLHMYTAEAVNVG